MPPGVFMGRIVGAGEPLWTDDDRTWAVALLDEEAEQCGGCGAPLAETTDPDNEFRYASEIVRCHRCTEQQSAADEHHNSKAKPGFLVRTTLTALPMRTGGDPPWQTGPSLSG